MPALSDGLAELQGSGIRESLHFKLRIEIGGREIHRIFRTCAKADIYLIPCGILVKVALFHDKKCKEESCVIIFVKVHRGFPLEDTILETRFSGKMSTCPVRALSLRAAICGALLAEILRELGLKSGLSSHGVVRERRVDLEVVWIVPSPTRHVLIKLHGVATGVVGISCSAQGSFVKFFKVSLLIGTNELCISKANYSCYAKNVGYAAVHRVVFKYQVINY